MSTYLQNNQKDRPSSGTPRNAHSRINTANSDVLEFRKGYINIEHEQYGDGIIIHYVISNLKLSRTNWNFSK